MDWFHLPDGTVDIVRVSIPDEQYLLDDASSNQVFLNLLAIPADQLCGFCVSVPFKYIGFHEKIPGGRV